MAKRRKLFFQSFESRKPSGSFVTIADDMMQSEAWKSLNAMARALYLEIKSKYRPEKSANGTVIDFHKEKVILPETEWKQLFGNYNTFRKYLDILIEHGFLEKPQSGKNTRTPNLYWFSDKWQKWKAKKPPP